jgi:hypothetical protein
MRQNLTWLFKVEEAENAKKSHATVSFKEAL